MNNKLFIRILSVSLSFILFLPAFLCGCNNNASHGHGDGTTAPLSDGSETTSPVTSAEAITTAADSQTTVAAPIKITPTADDLAAYDKTFASYLSMSLFPTDAESEKLLSTYTAAFTVKGGTAFFGGAKHTGYPECEIFDGDIFVPLRTLSDAFGINPTLSDGFYTHGGKSIAFRDFTGGAVLSLSDTAEALGYKCFFDGSSFAFVKTEITSSDKDETVYKKAHTYLLYENPVPSEIMSLLSVKSAGVHPRIIADADRFKELRALIISDKTARLWANKLLRYADELVSGGVPDYSTYDGKRIGCANRDTNKLMYILIAYRLTGAVKYADKAYLYLKAFASFPSWNPSHFLDVGNICASFAVAYDWCYDTFTDAQRAEICEAVRKKGIDIALKNYTSRASWSGLVSNWNFVCNGGLLIAALAFSDEYPRECSLLASLSLRALNNGLLEFAPMGGWEEGSGYWEYGNQYLSYVILSLKTALGSEFGYYYNTPGLDNTAYYALALDGACGAFNYHDANAKSLFNAYQMSFHAYMTHDEAIAYTRARDIETFDFIPNMIDFICLIPKATAANLPVDIYISGEETGAMRSSFGSKNDVYLAYHCGQNTANHFNYDCGNFIFDALGVRFAVDNGYAAFSDYDAGGWSEREINRFYVKRTEGQNCYVINPSYATGQKTNTCASVTERGTSPDISYAVMDLTSAYSDDVLTARRGVMLTDGRSAAVIRDEITFRQKSDFYWFMQTTAEVKISGNTATLTQDGKTLVLEFSANQPLTLSVSAAVPLQTSNQNAGTLPVSTNRICIGGKVSSTFDLTVKLTPDDGKPHAPFSECVRPIAEWHGLCAEVIK